MPGRRRSTRPPRTGAALPHQARAPPPGPGPDRTCGGEGVGVDPSRRRVRRRARGGLRRGRLPLAPSPAPARCRQWSAEGSRRSPAADVRARVVVAPARCRAGVGGSPVVAALDGHGRETTARDQRGSHHLGRCAGGHAGAQPAPEAARQGATPDRGGASAARSSAGAGADPGARPAGPRTRQPAGGGQRRLERAVAQGGGRQYRQHHGQPLALELHALGEAGAVRAHRQVAAQGPAPQDAAAPPRHLLADLVARRLVRLAPPGKAGPGLEDQRPDLGGVAPQHPCHVGVRHVVQLGQHQGRALLDRQAPEVPQQLAQLGPLLHLLRQPGGGLLDLLHGLLAPRAQQRQAAVARDRVQPRP